MPFSISLTPAKAELTLKSNQNATKAYDLQNDTDNPITLDLTILRWQPSGTDGSVEFTSTPGPFRFYIINADLRGQTQITLGPKKKQQIVIGIEQTEKDLVGEYYYTVLFGQKNELTSLVSTTQSSGQIGSHLILNIGNPSPRKIAQVESFTAPTLVDNIFGVIPIQGLIKNTSNHYLSFTGQLDITKNGQPYSQIYLSGDTILSNHTRSLRCIDSISKKEPLALPCRLASPLAPGKYTITLSTASDLSLSGNNQITVIALPFTLLVVVALLTLSYYLYYRLTQMRKK